MNLRTALSTLVILSQIVTSLAFQPSIIIARTRSSSENQQFQSQSQLQQHKHKQPAALCSTKTVVINGKYVYGIFWYISTYIHQFQYKLNKNITSNQKYDKYIFIMTVECMKLSLLNQSYSYTLLKVRYIC